MWLHKNVFCGITCSLLESRGQSCVTKLGSIWHILALKLNMEITNQFETRLCVWPGVWFESQCLLTLSEMGWGHHFITFYSGITRLVILGMSVSVLFTCQQKDILVLRITIILDPSHDFYHMSMTSRLVGHKSLNVTRCLLFTDLNSPIPLRCQNF